MLLGRRSSTPVDLMSEDEFMEECHKLNRALSVLGSLPELKSIRDRLRKIASILAQSEAKVTDALGEIIDLLVDVDETMQVVSVVESASE